MSNDIVAHAGASIVGDFLNHIFEGFKIRVVAKDDAPWFIAQDVARALGYRMASDATRILDAKHRDTHVARTPGGPQSVTVVSEAGLYRLIMRSDQPRAARMQAWVEGDVLPSIRRTGSYVEPAAAAPAIDLSVLFQSKESTLALMAESLRQLQAERTLRITAESQVAEQVEVIAELAPKAEYFDAFMDGSTLCLPSAAGRALGVSFRKMLGELRDRKILTYDHAGDLIAKSQWSVATGAGYFDHKIGTRPDGDGGRVARTQLYVTKLGFEWLGNEILAGRLSGANEAQPRSPRKPRAKRAA